MRSGVQYFSNFPLQASSGTLRQTHKYEICWQKVLRIQNLLARNPPPPILIRWVQTRFKRVKCINGKLLKLLDDICWFYILCPTNTVNAFLTARGGWSLYPAAYGWWQGTLWLIQGLSIGVENWLFYLNISLIFLLSIHPLQLKNV